MITWARPGALTSPLADGVHCPLGGPVTAPPPGAPISYSIPIYWDKHGMHFLLGIGRGQPLLGLSVPLASWTEAKTAGSYLPRARANTWDDDDICPGTSQAHPQRSSKSHLPTLRCMAFPLMRDLVPPPAKLGPS